MAGQYWFPSMSVSEIVEAFSGWGLSVSPQSVVHPSSDFVTKIYTACLQQVTGITDLELQRPVQSAVNTLDYIDIYHTALAQNILLMHLQRFARAAKINDFTAKDLAFPEPDRTRSIFSAFINLVKFSEQCESFITGLKNQSSSVMKERERTIDKRAEAEKRLTTIKAKMAEDEPACEKYRIENEQITAYLMSCKEKQLDLLATIKALKEEKNKHIQRKEAIHAEMDALTDNIGRVRSRIVQSPDRIKRNIITMGSTASEDKKTVAMNETKIRDLQAKINALLNIEKDVRSCVEGLRSIEKEIRALEEHKKELSDFKDQLSKKTADYNDLISQRDRAHMQLSKAEEKMARAQKHATDKRTASQQTLERLKQDYEKMALERQDNDKNVEQMRLQADEIEHEMADHLKRSQGELNELLTEYWTLRHATEVYMEMLANKLGMQVTST
ncbi:hypothetical protein QCA50_007867 [Cerrena zonata]|uniref:Kinetochore protein NUF2 n=1 Tax=Cerrena zonata TaxID=2478898 RepID=A0AAW0GI95_9APHY